MKTQIYPVAVLASLLSLSATAQDNEAYLRPVDGYLSSFGHNHHYLVLVRDILVRGAAQSPALMVTLPSFSEESMVFIEPRDREVFVVSATTTKQIWSTEKKDEIKVEQKEKAIKTEIADQICAVFALATSQARYPKAEGFGLDGVTYQFSAFATGVGVRAGKTWSPEPRSTCGMLVSLGEHMHSYVRGEISAEKLDSEARAILRVLKKTP
jgi:hypothetical protein